ncbi:lysostaphin resistance A-like protein [Elusimicrobiota bacterium]
MRITRILKQYFQGMMLAAVFYSVLLVIAAGWRMFKGNPNIFIYPGVEPGLLFASPVIGIISGLVVIGISRLMLKYFEWAKSLMLEFKELLGPLSNREIFILALSSGIAEECFFRGVLCVEVGILWSSLIFAAVHIGPDRRYLVWTFSTFLIGLLFGWYYQCFGDLVAPVIAHFFINYVNLKKIVSF